MNHTHEQKYNDLLGKYAHLVDENTALRMELGRTYNAIIRLTKKLEKKESNVKANEMKMM